MAKLERALIKTSPLGIEETANNSDRNQSARKENSFFRIFGLKGDETYYNLMNSIALDCNTKFIPIDEASSTMNSNDDEKPYGMTSRSNWDADHHDKLIKMLNTGNE